MLEGHDYDVVIIGAAIAGATLMNILRDEGLNVLVLDKEAGVLEIPRAAHIDDEILRYFDQFDVIEQLSESFQVKGEYNFFDFEGRKFLSMPKAHILDQGFFTGYYFHQPDFEHYLRKRAVKAGATLLTQHEVTNIAQDSDGVTVTAQWTSESGDVQSFSARAKYVVACDGSTSPTRKRLGITMEKLAKESSNLVVDFRIKDGAVVPEDLGYCTWAKIGRDSTTIYVHMPKGVKRLEFDVPPGAAREDVEQIDNVYRLLEPWVRAEDVKEILRANIYTFHSLIANSWREGRVFLAGDAAHLSPPFLGQGACAAIRDVFNLGWKLARVVKGQSDEALLKTYESERKPHARELVYRAGKIGEMFRDHFKSDADDVRAITPSEHTIERPVLGHGLHGGGGGAGGRLAPQPRLKDGRLLDEVAGANFVVLGEPGIIDAMDGRTKQRLNALNAVILPDDGDMVKAAIRSLGGRVMITRPDHYLLGVANDAVEIAAIVGRAAGWLLVPVKNPQVNQLSEL